MGMRVGWVPGRVYRVGNPRARRPPTPATLWLPGPASLSAAGPSSQQRSLHRAGNLVKRSLVQGGLAGLDRPGPQGGTRHSAHPARTQSKSGANSQKARLTVISCKVSQNRGVSPIFVHKACHSPCSQNGSEKSPLEILRFPILVAFSHKELMVLF